MPWWGVVIIAAAVGIGGAVAMLYYIGRGMFRNF